VSTSGAQFASRIVANNLGDTTFNVTQYVVPVFFLQQNAGSTYLKAVPCTEKYASASESMLSQFYDPRSQDPFASTTGYLCPDTDTFTVANSLSSPGSGYEYVTVELTYCDQAAALLGYVDPNCSTDRSVSEQMFGLHNMQFDSKFVSQYFDPVQFHSNQTMNYFSANDLLFSLALMTANTTTQTLYEIEQTIITFDDNRFLP